MTLNWHSKKISLSKIFKFKKQIQINSNVPIILSGEQQRIKILIFEIKGYLGGRGKVSRKPYNLSLFLKRKWKYFKCKTRTFNHFRKEKFVKNKIAMKRFVLK